MTEKDKSQADKFKEIARKLETNDDEKRFDKMLGKIARYVPSVSPPNFEDDGFDAQSD